MVAHTPSMWSDTTERQREILRERPTQRGRRRQSQPRVSRVVEDEDEDEDEVVGGVPAAVGEAAVATRLH
jgi:hypothetical protein